MHHALLLSHINNGPFCFHCELRKKKKIYQTLFGFSQKKETCVIIRKKEKKGSDNALMYLTSASVKRKPLSIF